MSSIVFVVVALIFIVRYTPRIVYTVVLATGLCFHVYSEFFNVAKPLWYFKQSRSDGLSSHHWYQVLSRCPSAPRRYSPTIASSKLMRVLRESLYDCYSLIVRVKSALGLRVPIPSKLRDEHLRAFGEGSALLEFDWVEVNCSEMGIQAALHVVTPSKHAFTRWRRDKYRKSLEKRKLSPLLILSWVDGLILILHQLIVSASSSWSALNRKKDDGLARVRGFKIRRYPRRVKAHFPVKTLEPVNVIEDDLFGYQFRRRSRAYLKAYRGRFRDLKIRLKEKLNRTTMGGRRQLACDIAPEFDSYVLEGMQKSITLLIPPYGLPPTDLHVRIQTDELVSKYGHMVCVLDWTSIRKRTSKIKMSPATDSSLPTSADVTEILSTKESASAPAPRRPEDEVDDIGEPSMKNKFSTKLLDHARGMWLNGAGYPPTRTKVEQKVAGFLNKGFGRSGATQASAWPPTTLWPAEYLQNSTSEEQLNSTSTPPAPTCPEPTSTGVEYTAEEVPPQKSGPRKRAYSDPRQNAMMLDVVECARFIQKLIVGLSAKLSSFPDYKGGLGVLSESGSGLPTALALADIGFQLMTLAPPSPPTTQALETPSTMPRTIDRDPRCGLSPIESVASSFGVNIAPGTLGLDELRETKDQVVVALFVSAVMSPLISLYSMVGSLGEHPDLDGWPLPRRCHPVCAAPTTLAEEPDTWLPAFWGLGDLPLAARKEFEALKKGAPDGERVTSLASKLLPMEFNQYCDYLMVPSVFINSKCDVVNPLITMPILPSSMTNPMVCFGITESGGHADFLTGSVPKVWFIRMYGEILETIRIYFPCGSLWTSVYPANTNMGNLGKRGAAVGGGGSASLLNSVPSPNTNSSNKK